jgi:electron transfer flavoprotein beta subunit
VVRMSQGFHLVVCGSIVPDPLQKLEPVEGAEGPALKNEMMLPAQKVAFELVALDGAAGGFTDAWETAEALADGIKAIPELDRSRLLLFGGCSSASRDAGVTMQMVGERLEIHDQFLAVDELTVQKDGTLRILERIEAGRYLVSACDGPPLVAAWATGRLPEPANNAQLGMQNMRMIMPALQKAPSVPVGAAGVEFLQVEIPKQRRSTRVVEDASVEEMAREIVEWIRE